MFFELIIPPQSQHDQLISLIHLIIDCWDEEIILRCAQHTFAGIFVGATVLVDCMEATTKAQLVLLAVFLAVYGIEDASSCLQG